MSQVLSEGSVLGGRYAIEARLGDGGMGTVYRARHQKFGRAFAIKVLHAGLMQNPKVLKRFEREAEMAGRLRHTNVASVVDVGVTDDGVHYIAMEYASGVSLTHLLADGPMAESRMLDIVKQLCRGLQHAHEAGLIHRDFKPDNVIVEPVAGGGEVARIVDWGVSILREQAGDPTSDERLTTKGIVVGTPHYMAPEQARGAAMDHRVDLFALGLICYELLTGLLPFDGSGVDIARANMQTPTPPIAERAPGVRVDPVLEAIVRTLLAKNREDRPASGSAALELFELYERDRASCALLLGVEIPVEDRRTGAIEELDDAEVADDAEDAPVGRAHSPSQNQNGTRDAESPHDPERDRETDELASDNQWRRLAAVAAIFAIALAIVLYLGLRTTPRATALTIATADAREEVAVLETQRALPVADVPIVDVPGPAPTDEIALIPTKPPVKKAPPSTGSGSGNAKPAVEPPSAAAVAKLYGAVGRELSALEAKKGMDATIELWPRYRWIRINEWITTPERRAHIATQLERLRTDIKAAG
ncbi:MAG TPA: serine/threonine-protein kinase [Kofleriaceae bacterium]|nr:serine/threonine-protein kinase [Kofleriaceae bacterium]